MTDEMVRADTTAMMMVVGMVILILEVNQPGVKGAIAESVQELINGLPDSPDPHSLKSTFRLFHEMLTTNRPLDELFH